MARRKGRQTKADLAKLRTADNKDYMLLLKACTEALLTNKNCVILRCSHLTRFPKDFPKGRIIRKEGDSDIRRLQAKQLFDWLRTMGVTALTRADFATAKQQFTNFEKELFQ